MTRTIEAIYENGVLRPIQPLEGIEEKSRLQVTLQVSSSPRPAFDPGIGVMPDEDAEAILRAVQEECERVDLRDWQ
jgi:predicted DNA-binding antitoxin AbrB/MazE fold protein